MSNPLVAVAARLRYGGRLVALTGIEGSNYRFSMHQPASIRLFSVRAVRDVMEISSYQRH